MSETPTTTTSQKSIAIRPQFVLQYAPNLYCTAFGASEFPGKGNSSVLPPFVLQYTSHLYRSTSPICIAIRLPFVSHILLGKSWWLWSPGCSPNQGQPKHNHNHILPKNVLHLMPHQTAFDGTSDEGSLCFLCGPLCRRGIWCGIPGCPNLKKWGSAP